MSSKGAAESDSTVKGWNQFRDFLDDHHSRFRFPDSQIYLISIRIGPLDLITSANGACIGDPIRCWGGFASPTLLCRKGPLDRINTGD